MTETLSECPKEGNSDGEAGLASLGRNAGRPAGAPTARGALECGVDMAGRRNTVQVDGEVDLAIVRRIKKELSIDTEAPIKEVAGAARFLASAGDGRDAAVERRRSVQESILNENRFREKTIGKIFHAPHKESPLGRCGREPVGTGLKQRSDCGQAARVPEGKQARDRKGLRAGRGMPRAA